MRRNLLETVYEDIDVKSAIHGWMYLCIHIQIISTWQTSARQNVFLHMGHGAVPDSQLDELL